MPLLQGYDRSTASPSSLLNGVLILISLVAVVLPTLIVTSVPRMTVHRHRTIASALVVPPTAVPAVEPVELAALAPEDARAFNQSVPFSTDPNPAARPFRFPGDDVQLERATDCMAAAALYEAGNDPDGQRAVAQVVINRVRHPAFPKTICGVIFQGSERTTGCQFTFTCDGALLAHRWSDESWAAARAVAKAALSGTVFGPVGYATHYHTDWVVPYWQSSLDKVAAVHTHLFFRWTGWWGTPGAFHRQVSPDEPVIQQLAAYSAAHGAAATLAATGSVAGGIAPDGSLPAPVDPDSFLVTLDRRLGVDEYAGLATHLCGERQYCKVMGWTDHTKTPAVLPLQATQIASMSFSYLRDRAHGFDKALWNCAEFKRKDAGQCMKVQIALPDAPSQGVQTGLLPGVRPELLPGAKPVLLPGAARPVLLTNTPPLATAPIDLHGVRREPLPLSPPASTHPKTGTDRQPQRMPDQAAMNISGGSAISTSAPPAILRRSAPASGSTRSAK